MKSQIVTIDMHIRDERIFEYMKERIAINNGAAQINAEEISKKFYCHPNTARNILARLRGAGLIFQQGTSRGGFVYRIDRETA